MKLNVKAMALAGGILWGAAMLLLTLSSLMRGAGQHLTLLSGVYFGYQITYMGAVLGLVYGFVTGVVGGGLLAWLYNALLKDG